MPYFQSKNKQVFLMGISLSTSQPIKILLHCVHRGYEFVSTLSTRFPWYLHESIVYVYIHLEPGPLTLLWLEGSCFRKCHHSIQFLILILVIRLQHLLSKICL